MGNNIKEGVNFNSPEIQSQLKEVHKELEQVKLNATLASDIEEVSPTRELAEITDEDAIEVAKMANTRLTQYNDLIVLGRDIVNNKVSVFIEEPFLENYIQIIDFLRSKGYNIPNAYHTPDNTLRTQLQKSIAEYKQSRRAAEASKDDKAVKEYDIIIATLEHELAKKPVVDGEKSAEVVLKDTIASWYINEGKMDKEQSLLLADIQISKGYVPIDDAIKAMHAYAAQSQPPSGEVVNLSDISSGVKVSGWSIKANERVAKREKWLAENPGKDIDDYIWHLIDTTPSPVVDSPVIDWVKVEDEEPSIGVPFLAFYKGDIFIDEICWDGNSYTTQNEYTHWQPLPEKPNN